MDYRHWRHYPHYRQVDSIYNRGRFARMDNNRLVNAWTICVRVDTSVWPWEIFAALGCIKYIKYFFNLGLKYSWYFTAASMWCQCLGEQNAITISNNFFSNAFLQTCSTHHRGGNSIFRIFVRLSQSLKKFKATSACRSQRTAGS
jgi:hypothetical protein